MIWYLQPCLNWTETLYPFSAFQMERFSAFQVEISFDDGSFQNLIQKSLSSVAPTDMSRNWSPDKSNEAMIPMAHTTWYLGYKGSTARRGAAAPPQPENN